MDLNSCYSFAMAGVNYLRSFQKLKLTLYATSVPSTLTLAKKLTLRAKEDDKTSSKLIIS